MPAVYAYAPGKVILTGEHAVVYGQPAIAAPVNEVRARASVEANPKAEPGSVFIIAPDIALKTSLADLPRDHPMVTVIQGVQNALGVKRLPALTLKVSSTIPIAAGLGSGAAISVAVSRALSAFLGSPLNDEEVSRLAFETDQYYHGTPSGIDNTVISFGMLVFFMKEQPIELLTNKRDFTLVIADTGEKSHTGEVVGELRQRVQKKSERYHVIFDQIGKLTLAARRAIEHGELNQLGKLFSDNHALLRQLDVSSEKLDLLVKVALDAGALGAKLSGAGQGGNMIALVNEQDAEKIASCLKSAGAVNTIITTIPKTI